MCLREKIWEGHVKYRGGLPVPLRLRDAPVLDDGNDVCHCRGRDRTHSVAFRVAAAVFRNRRLDIFVARLSRVQCVAGYEGIGSSSRSFAREVSKSI